MGKYILVKFIILIYLITCINIYIKRGSNSPTHMHLSYDQTIAFQAVAKHGSFSKAAEALFRSQSAVSIQVAKLEATIGRPLFDRTTRYLALTDAGQVLLKYVSEIEGLLQEAVQELEDLDLLERGRLVLCTSDTTGCYRLPAILKPFQERYPGIDIVVKNATSLRTIQAVVNNEVDLGIATLAYLAPGIESIPLFSRDDVLITHPDHPLAHRRTIHLKDLERYPLILLDQHCASRRLIDDLCEKARVTLDIKMELSSIEVIKRFVRIDAGLSIVPSIAISEEIENGVLAQVKISDFQGRPRQKMGAIYKKGRYLSRSTQSFLEAMRGKAL